jgi:hypothetical protein
MELPRLYCPIRKIEVADLPEERVRQQLIAYMVQERGFPADLLAVEKELRQMPHLQLTPHALPQRRADLLCFAKDIHPHHSLYPLLLVECKAIPLNQKVLYQVAGYNHFIQAYFIAITDGQQMKTGWRETASRQYTFIDGLPTYSQLLSKLDLKY